MPHTTLPLHSRALRALMVTPLHTPTPSTPPGGLLGGHIGDWAAARHPDHGRIAVCQFSVAVGVPLSVLLFKVRAVSLPA